MDSFSWQDEKDKEEENLRARQIRWPSFMPFFWLGLAAVLGPFAAEELSFPWHWWAGLVIGTLLFILLRRKPHEAVQTVRRLPAVLALTAFALTAMLYQLSLPSIQPNNLLYYHKRGPVTITGLVVSPPEIKQNSLQVVVEACSLKAENLPVREPQIDGKLIFYLSLGTELRYGDIVEIKGELLPPEEGVNFSWRDYLKHQGIYSTILYPRVRLMERDRGNPLKAALFRLRESGGRVLSKIFPVRRTAC